MGRNDVPTFAKGAAGTERAMGKGDRGGIAALTIVFVRRAISSFLRHASALYGIEVLHE
jgi:hypothetical protein